MKQLAFPLIATLCLTAGLTAAPPGEGVRVEPDVVYGHKDGMALTFDVIRPARPNGAGILMIQSGGWYSNWVDPKGWPASQKRYLDKGFTLFIVRHGSAPRYAVPDAVADVRRAVRVIRLKAKEYGIDPERLGVIGGSAGGHLSLMLGTTGDDGDPKAADEVLRQGSRVAAVVAFFPPTDLRGFVKNPPEAIKKIPGLKPPLTFDPKLEADCSPVTKATARSAPSLLIHGDKDTLVPLHHSENMVEAMKKASAECKLIIIEGAGHGFNGEQNEKTVFPAVMGWFESHLTGKKTNNDRPE